MRLLNEDPDFKRMSDLEVECLLKDTRVQNMILMELTRYN